MPAYLSTAARERPPDAGRDAEHTDSDVPCKDTKDCGRHRTMGKPETIILNGEADVLRDEGEAYARKLRDVRVPVTAMRFQGMIHDFVMLNALDGTKACRAAMNAAVAWIKEHNSINRIK